VAGASLDTASETGGQQSISPARPQVNSRGAALTEHIVAENKPGLKALLMGNEAIARGAIEGGVRVSTSYPGTPASEIMETLSSAAKDLGFYAEWSVNETVAFEVAAGASLFNVRSFCSMKNAGLNLCMDMLTTLVYGGVRGGMVIVVADDPGARTSSNEQDQRFAASWAEIPCLEPSNQQEAKDMVRDAFDISERTELPVMVRSVARISHSLGDVTLGKIPPSSRKVVFDKHWKLPFRWNVYGPPSTHSKHVWLHTKLSIAKKLSEESPYNSLELLKGAKLGVIASGVAAAYVKEALRWLELEDKFSFLKIGFSHPLPEKKVARILKKARRILIVEDGDPFIENQVRIIAKDFAPNVEILGKNRSNPLFEPYGELDPDMVASAVAKCAGVKVKAITPIRKHVKEEITKLIVPRSSAFCAGCPHIGTYWGLRMALHRVGGKFPIIHGDIGCYEMAGYGLFAKDIESSDSIESVKYPADSPYELLDTLYVMGAGIGLAQGTDHAGYTDGRVVAVAGDSTFFHACIPGLINAVFNKAKLTYVIFDNRWTAMTGHQPHPGTGVTALGESTFEAKIEDICKACGVEYVKVVDAYNPREVQNVLVEALQQPSVSVVISRGECGQVWQRADRKKGIKKLPYEVELEKCNGCRLCVQMGCPAITFDPDTKKAGVDDLLCTACGLCAAVCPFRALSQPMEVAQT
jgi:indolepyruvate ferredoxin oxidoreductase alpha subunit